MSDEIDHVAAIERILAVSAGGYLRNPVRERYLTCNVCATPIGIERQYDRCWRCNQNRTTLGVADLVVPLTYGIEGEQSGWVVRHYKNDYDAAARHRHRLVINRLLFLGIMLHQACIEHRAGQVINLRLAVPSLSGRQGVHPFAEMTRSMHATPATPLLLPAADATSQRIVSADQFVLAPEVDLTDQHILVLDDTWTTGSRTQSAALTLRRHGAKYVSVMVVSRYLRPSYAKNAEFIRSRLQHDYNPHICPVTGGDCP